jgi:hypothetical protein
MISALGLILIAALLAVVALLIVLVVVFATNKSVRSSTAGKVIGLGLLIGVPLIGLIVLAGLSIVGFATVAVTEVESRPAVESMSWSHGSDETGPPTWPNEFLERDRAQTRETFKTLKSQSVEAARSATVTDEAGKNLETSVVVESPTGAAAEVPVAGPTQNSATRAAADVPMIHFVDPAPLTGRLHARSIVSEEPDWVRNGTIPDDKGILVPLSSQRFATIEEAEQQVTRLAVGYLKNFYAREHPARGEWNVPVSIIDRDAVNTIVAQQIEKDFGKMYLVHLRLNLNDRLRGSLQEAWRGQVVTQRLWMLGGGVGLMTLLLGTAAGYFRLDNLTGGKYRGRLKLAAASLIGAAGLVTGAVVRFV